MLVWLILPIATRLIPGPERDPLRAAILRPFAQIDTWFFNNPRAIRVFLLWCLPGLMLLVVSIFVPSTAAFCPGALWLMPIGLGFASVASRLS